MVVVFSMEHTTNTLYNNNFGQLVVIFCLYGQTILHKVVNSGKFLMTDWTVFCCLRLDYLHYFGLCLILMSICVHCACDCATMCEQYFNDYLFCT